MKSILNTILFLSTTSMLFAHSGHGFFDGGIAHYLSSFIHSGPIIIAAVAVFIWAKKKISQSN
jgi:hypothetical protein